MSVNKTAISIVFAVLCATAIFTGMWGFLTGGSAVYALIAAIMLLVAAQLILFFVQIDQRKDHEPTVAYDTIVERLERIENNVARTARTASLARADMPAELPHLQNPPQMSDSAATHSSVETGMAGAAQLSQLDDGATDARSAYYGPAYLNDQNLSLYLEPVVDISTMQTRFYRAEMAFTNDLLERVRLSDMADAIAEEGNSAAADMKLFNRLGPVIERLAEKEALSGVICPISRHSFSNQVFLEELTRYLKHHPELARVLVIEISQANLAGLSQDGMAGLAFLAQIGGTFSLGGAGLESPDLDSLSSLGFRYLDMDYAENIERYGLQAFAPGGPAAQLRDLASGVGISLIGSGLVRKTQYDALNHIIQFGRGAAFSNPRLVRDNLGAVSAARKAA